MHKLYDDRDVDELDALGDFFSRHVKAMTEEGLHSKGAIAAELAYRDEKIAELEAKLDRICYAVSEADLWDELEKYHQDDRP